MDHDSVKGVVQVPLYSAIPCEESTAKMAVSLWLIPTFAHASAAEIELHILRWLMDNNMAIVKRN